MSIDVRKPIPEGFLWIQDRVHTYLKKHRIPFQKGYKGMASIRGKLVEMFSGVVVPVQYGPQIEAHIKEKQKAKAEKEKRSIALYKKRKTEGVGTKVWKRSKPFDFSLICDDVWNHMAIFLHPIDVMLLSSCTTWLHRNLRQPVWPDDENKSYIMISRYVRDNMPSESQKKVKKKIIYEEWGIDEKRDKDIINWANINTHFHQNHLSYHFQAAGLTCLKWLYEQNGWKAVYKYGRDVRVFLRKKYVLERVSLRKALEMFKNIHS